MSNVLEVREIKPGYLVVEQVSIKGGISYSRIDTGDELLDGRRIRRWETESVIEDEEEFNEARRLRSAAYKETRRVCANTPAGLICPANRKHELDEAVAEIKRRSNQFNNEAATCHLVTRYTCHSIETSNRGVIAALSEQIAETAERVERFIQEDDALVLRKAQKAILQGMTPEEVLALSTHLRDVIIGRARAQLIRSAITDLGRVHELFENEASERVKELVKQSRRIARSIIKNVEKRELSVNTALEEVDSSGIQKTRIAFVTAAAMADGNVEFDEVEEELEEEESPWDTIPARQLEFIEEAFDTQLQ